MTHARPAPEAPRTISEQRAGTPGLADLADLDGPAIWTARVVGDLVSEWRAYEDTPEVRRRLGVLE